MSDNPLEDLIIELRSLRIENSRLKTKNRDLHRRINAESTNERFHNGGYAVGDKVSINTLSCPGVHRAPNNTTDVVGTIHKIKLPWVYITTESNIKIQRYPKNIKLLKRKDE